MEAFTNTMNSSKSKDERVQALVEGVDMAVFTTDIEKQVAILHSSKMIGGTRACPAKKMICLLGMGTEAACVEVNIASIIKECIIRAQKSEDMQACEDADALDALIEPGNRAAINNKGSASFVPAPFLRDAMLEAISKDPWELISVAFSAAKAYDNTHDDGNAAAHTEAFALWAWCVRKGTLSQTRYFVHPDNGEMKAFTKERHTHCIIASLSQEEGRTESSADTLAVLHQISVSI
eukprot:12043597-Ditylum_brightwellii.AAC.1